MSESIKNELVITTGSGYMYFKTDATNLPDAVADFASVVNFDNLRIAKLTLRDPDMNVLDEQWSKYVYPTAE